MFSKIDVNGTGKAPLYAWLTEQATQPDGPGDIKWNFAKFVVGRNGRCWRASRPHVTLRARGPSEHRERARRLSDRRPCGCEGLRVGEGRTTIAREPGDNP